ncbi:MAG TPA: hypothetical protein VJN18_34630 [Polyangiaceae bacterium]|nr:hypothetical protein [Polyangiaceae bacterium]
MSVTGGRRPWAWAGSGAISLGLALLPTLACGSRTSALEQEAYDPGQDPYGGRSSGGSSSVPQAGGNSTPIAGSSVGGSSSSSTATPVCEKYCNAYGPKCSARLEGRDCMAACIQEMTAFGSKCQTLGMNALKCLTPFFQNPAEHCDVAVSNALIKCESQVEGFDDCKDIPDEPQPNPQP